MKTEKKEKTKEKVEKKEACGCSRLYEPVCANNGIDYNNEDCATKCG